MRTTHRTLTLALLAAFAAIACESTEITAPEEDALYSMAATAAFTGTREAALQQANFNAKPNENANPKAHAAAGGKGKGPDKGKDENPSRHQPPPPSGSSASPRDVTDPPMAPQPSGPAVANALVDLDFSKATSRAEALAMLAAAGGAVARHTADPLKDWTPSHTLDLVGFRAGEGLVMRQPANSSVTPYFRFDQLGARPGLWQLVERRFSPGWTTEGGPDRAAGYKVDGIGWVGGNGSARLEITNTDQYVVNNGFIPVPGNGSHARTLESPYGTFLERLSFHMTEELRGTTFHKYQYFYEASARKGTWKAWLDGRLIADASVTYASVNAPFVNRSSAGMNFNKKRLKDQYIVIRRIIILDSRTHPNPWELR